MQRPKPLHTEIDRVGTEWQDGIGVKEQFVSRTADRDRIQGKANLFTDFLPKEARKGGNEKRML